MLGGIGVVVVGGGIGAAFGAAGGLAVATECQGDDSTQRGCGALFLASVGVGALVGAFLGLSMGAGGAVHNASSKQVRSEHKAVTVAGATLGVLAGLSGLTLANGGKLSRSEPLPAAFWLLLSSSAGGVLFDRIHATKLGIQAVPWQPKPDALGALASVRF